MSEGQANGGEYRAAPQEDRPEEPKKVLRLARKWADCGDTIQKLAHNRWYVADDANLLDLADDLNEWPSINAVGVVNQAGKASGIIVRQDLFDLLGRPFGRDVLRRESIARVALGVKPFFNDSSIFSVTEEIGKGGLQAENRFFPLRTAGGEFAGIFSTQDLLIHLSELTQSDIALARSIQGRIVRDALYIDNPRFEMVGASFLSKGLGGDFYHVVKYADKRWSINLCDVSGKGVAASLMTCALWGVMQSYDYNGGVRSLVDRLNRFFIGTFGLERHATGIFADFEPASGTLLMCDQGHGHGYIIRGKKLLRMKTTEKSYPIGVSPELRPELFRYQLQAGDMVIVNSDGLVDQKNKSGDSFGLAGVKRVIETHGSLGLKEVRNRLVEEFNAFRGNTPQYDDVSFILLRYK